jgi:hypothetical protein
VGYRKDDQGVLVASDDAPLVVLMFQLYATGQYSHSDTADALNRQGYTIPSVRYQTRLPLSKTSVREILRNPVYRGIIRFGGQTYPGLHTPLITEELWETVQQVREPRAGKRGRVSIRPKDEHAGLLTEIAYCAHCGSRMVYQPGDGIQRKRNYYQCSRHINWKNCDARMVWTQAVDTQLITVVQTLALPTEWQAAIIAEAEALLNAEHPDTNQTRATLTAEIERWGEVYARGAVSKQKFETVLAELEAKRAAAPHVPLRPDLTQAAAVLANFDQVIATAHLAERRAILRQLFCQVWVQRHEIVAITPTSLYMPLVVAARKRYSSDKNNQIDPADRSEPGGRGSAKGAHTRQKSVQGLVEARPAHQTRKP